MPAPDHSSTVAPSEVLPDAVRLLQRQLSEARAAQQEAEKRAAELEARLHLIEQALEVFPDSLWIKDEAGRYQFVNQAFRRFHNLGDRDVYGCTAAEILPAGLATKIQHGDSLTLSGPHLYSDEIQHVAASGAIAWVKTLKHMIVADGQTIGLLGTTRDVTARHKAVEAQVEAERALLNSQRRESLGLLAGGIAHDFNNLLTGILGHADLALLDAAPGSPLSESLTQIVNGAHSAARLASQLLAYAGKGPVVIQPIDLNMLIREITDLMRVLLPKSAQLHFQLAPDLPTIAADTAQLQQIVLNLVTNAADALTSSHGSITITTTYEYLAELQLAQYCPTSELAAGVYVKLTVQDSGIGMDAETMQRIFDPFFSTKRSGRGLGLAAVQGIARAHHGAITVESMPDIGSVFTVWLPASDIARPIPAAESPMVQENLSVRVLLIDDETPVRNVLRRMLEQLGMQVYEAENGERALYLLEQGIVQPQLVLLDLTMPGMDGATMARILRHSFPQLPVILISGYHSAQIAKDLHDLQPLLLLQKPMDLNRLRATIKRVLGDAAGPQS